MEFRDYYATLGLKRDAKPEEIKRAYRRRARETHPDVNDDPAATEDFKAVNEAYEVLRDPEKRAAYDRLGANWREGERFQAPPDWDGGFSFEGGGFTEAEPEDMSAFFEELFGRHGGWRSGPDGGSGGKTGGAAAGRSGPWEERGFAPRRETRARLDIDIADAYRGARRSLVIRAPEIDRDGRMTLRERRIDVDVPKGVGAGEHLRVRDAGGDLLLEIGFRPHPVFAVDGRDVSLDLPVTPWEAALGSRVRMPTPGGEVELKVPAGARSGQRLRLKGKGVPGKPPGDLYARISIVAPPAETAEGRALYEKMAREMPFDPRAGLEV